MAAQARELQDLRTRLADACEEMAVVEGSLQAGMQLCDAVLAVQEWPTEEDEADQQEWAAEEDEAGNQEWAAQDEAGGGRAGQEWPAQEDEAGRPGEDEAGQQEWPEEDETGGSNAADGWQEHSEAVPLSCSRW